MKNNLIRGIRKASDFLMALQLTGAFKRDALPNLQVRLPAVVIGGGLTGDRHGDRAVGVLPAAGREDARRATRRWSRELGEARVRGMLRRRGAARSSTSSSRTAAPSAPSARAPTRAGEAPELRRRWCAAWGGVTLAYRKRLVDSPAYRLNHEEVIKALEEGIAFAENLNPIEAVPDECGARRRRWCSSARAGATDAASDGRAAGADRAGRRRHVAEHHLREGAPGHVPARREAEVLPAASARVRDGDGAFAARAGSPTASSRRTTATAGSSRYYGDNHPRYAGNVVKAMASAKHGYPHVVALFARRARGARSGASSRSATRRGRALVARLDDELLARVERVVRLTPTIVEVIVQGAGGGAALPARASSTGCRTSSRSAPRVRVDGHAAADGRHRAHRRVGRQGAGPAVADRARDGRVEPAVRVPAAGRAGRRDGADRHADRDSATSENVLLPAAASATPCCSRSPRRCASSGNRVIYFAGYKKGEDLFKREEIEAATDQVIWSTDMGATIAPRPAAGRALPRQHRAGDARLRRAASSGEPLVPLDRRRPHHRHRLRPHDGGGQGGAARRAGAVPQAGPRRHRQHQLADAVHDEGGLRAVPAEARRPGDRQGRRSSSPASTRIRSWTASTSRT